MDYFNNRVREIELYFTFLENIDKENPILNYKNLEKSENDKINEVVITMPISPELIKIFKANAYLILYNLVEASFKEALWEILEKVQENNLDYTSISENIQKIWHNQQAWNFRNNTQNDFTKLIQDTAHSVLNNSVKFNKDYVDRKQLSGNINTKSIINLSSLYGFMLPKLDGQKVFSFDTVKNQRNNLAHGNLTFMECGKDYSIGYLVKLKNEIIVFMQEILQNINQFIADGKYKAAATTQ